MLKIFIKGLRDFMGRGGGKILAATIHMQESAFSHFMTDGKRQFDDKTFMAMGLMTSLCRDKIDDATLVAEGHLGPIMFREWKKPDGELVYTWSPKES